VCRLLTIIALRLSLASLPVHEASAQVTQDDDVAKHGLTERDFLRARQLAPGV
jgi:hypothetical protein